MNGLSQSEYETICARLGRTPNEIELGLFALNWSEHCSYKTSKRFLKLLPTTGRRVVQGPGENAGVIELENEWCVAFKVESHNHPSAVEPFHGAATGGRRDHSGHSEHGGRGRSRSSIRCGLES
jgi:phosphoribosylformylglycinamidine (FGAM) synthase-like enzyme